MAASELLVRAGASVLDVDEQAREIARIRILFPSNVWLRLLERG